MPSVPRQQDYTHSRQDSLPNVWPLTKSDAAELRNTAEPMNPISYILILMAMTVAPVSQIASVREVSTLIGAAIGARLFGEQHLRSRLAAACIIVLGVIAVAHG